MNGDMLLGIVLGLAAGLGVWLLRTAIAGLISEQEEREGWR